MFSENSKISNRQMQALLLLDILGLSVFTVPGQAVAIAGQSSFFLIPGAALIAGVYALLIHKLSMAYPGLTFVEYTKKIVGGPIGVLLSLGLMVHFFLLTGFHLRIFLEILKLTMLFQTPIWLTGTVMLLACAYIVKKGYECRGRTAEVLIILLVIPIIFLFGTAAVKSDYTNLLPLVSLPVGTFVGGSFLLALSFQGLLFLPLGQPFIVKQEETGERAFSAVLCIGVLLFLITVISMARFGKAEAAGKLVPALDLLNTIELPGSFIERQDAAMMKFFIISVFAGTNAGIFFLGMLGERLAKPKTHGNRFLFISLPIVLGISLWPENLQTAYQALFFLQKTLGAFYLFFVPPVLLLLSRGRRKV